MSISTLIKRHIPILLCLLLFTSIKSYAQRIYANEQDNGRSGLVCVNCVVNDASNAADGNPQTRSQINVVVGVGAQTWQEVIFSGPVKPAANTPVRLKLGTGDNLADLTVLGSVSIRAYNGDSPVGPSYSLGTLVTAASNNNQVDVGITPAQTYDRVRITLNGGLVGALSSLYVYEAYFNGPGPVACNTAIDELHGISPALLNLGVDIGGVQNPLNAIDGNINTASRLNAGVAAVGAYAQQTVIFRSPSVVGDSVRLTFAIPQALLDANVTSRIEVSTARGNFSNNDTRSLTSSLLTVRLLDLEGTRRRVTVAFAPASVFDRVQVRLGGGIANVLTSLDLYEVQRLIARPVISYNNAAITTGNVQACAGSSVTLTASSTVPNTTFTWYDAATGGNVVSTAATYTTPVLNASTTLYVAASRPGCTDQSERTPITITINNVPAAPAVSNPTVSVCPGQQATFTVQNTPGITIRWYTAATGGTPVFTGNTFTTGALTANTNYYAEAVAGGTCVSTTRTEVTAQVSPLPATPSLTDASVTICEGEVASLSVASPVAGVVYRWYTAPTGGTPVFTGSTFTTPILTANRTYYVEAENTTGCTSAARATATVTVNPLPDDPELAANSLTVDAGQTATINVSNAQTGITYNWYTSANAGTAVHTGNSYTTPALYTNTTYYVEAVNAAGCASENRTAVNISVTINYNSPCTFANEQSSNINGLCIGCGVTNRNLAIDADTTTSSRITVVAGLLGGFAEQELRFQQPGLAGDTVRFVIQTPVGLADANIAGRIEIALYNGATEVVRYSADDALVKVRLLGGNNRYAIMVPATGNYDRATIRLNSGVASLLSSVNVYYAVQQFPAPVFNNASPEICEGSTAQINITSPSTGSTFTWYDAPTGGNVVYTGTNFTTPALTETTTYYVENSRNGCSGSQRFPIQVLVNDPPAAPVVTPASAAIFSGQTATFTASAGNKTTIRWYDAATGGTLVHTGNSFTTPALSANKTYYAESSIGDCINPTRTPAPVTVTAVTIPDVAVTPATQDVNPGESATLTASSTTPGTVFNWYTTATGGTSIFTGPVFNTPAMFDDETYYAEAVVTATGARSATRASGAVTVNELAENPVPCDAAMSQTTDINGLVCLGCSIANAGGAIDGDRNTFSRINVPVGLANAYAQQTLRFPNTGRAGDSVIVDLGISGALANVNVLSQIAIATYNGNTYNNDRFTINGSLISIRLLDGTSRFRVAFAPQANFDRVEIRLNSTLAGVFNALNIYAASQSVAAPQVASSTVTTCQGSQATLTANVPDNVTVRWYTSPTGGTPVLTGSTFNTPVLNTNTTYYAEASRTSSNCAQTVRTPVNVTVTPAPAAPVVTTPTVTVCLGEPATFTAQAVPGVTFRWYETATGGTPIFTGASFTTPDLTETTSYYVEATAGTCGSSARTQVTANVATTPLVPQVSQTPVATCSGSSAVLSATSTQQGVTFRWYTTPTGGTPVFTGAQFTTPELTADATYYVEAMLGNCTSATRAVAEVDVNPTPANPTVTVNPAGGQVAAGQTATITATSTTAGATFRWYTTPTGGTAIHTGATFTTPALSSTTTYYVEARLASTGCTSASRTPVTITVNPVFSTDCDFANTQTTDVNGGLACIGCSVTGDDNSVNSDTTDFARLNLPVAVLGSYVSQTLRFPNGGIVGDTVTLKIRIPVALISASVLDRIQIASYNGATYNGDRTNLSSNLIRLQLLGGGETAYVQFAPVAAFDRIEIRLNSVVLGTFNTLDIFYASNQVEQPQVDATTVNICSGSNATFTVSNPRAGVVYRWFDTPTGGTPLFTGTSFITDELTATTTFYVESMRDANDCPNPNRVAVTANVTETPNVPTLSQNSATVCSGESVTFTVSNANGGTVRWYTSANGGTPVFIGASYTVSPVSNATYYAEISNGTCTSPSRATATVTVNPRPARPNVQAANVQICSGSTAVLRVQTPQTGVTYTWYTAATGGTVAGTGAEFTTDPLTASTSYFVEASNTTTSCINNSGRRRVDVTVTATPAAPTLSATSTTVCNGGDVTISVTSPAAGITYRWYTDATAGTPVFTGSTFTVDNVTADATYYVEAVTGGDCASSTRTQTTITVQPVPDAPDVELAGGGTSVCEGSSATLNIINPQSGLTYRWYSAATNGTLLFTGTSYTTGQITSSTTFYVEAMGNTGGCTSSTRASITVNATESPATPVITAADVEVCTGSTATLSVASPVAGVTYNWYADAGRTNLLGSGNTFETPVINTSTTFYVEAMAGECVSNTTAIVDVSVSTPPSAPVVADANPTICSDEPLTLTVTNPDPELTYRWYSNATGGTALSTGITYTVTINADATYYVEAVNATGCTSTTRTAVTVTVNPTPQAPELSTQGMTICPGSTATLSVTAQTGVTVNWYDAATGGSLVATGNSFTTPVLNTGATYYAEAVSDDGGCASTVRTAAVVSILQPLEAPSVTVGGTTTTSVTFTWNNVTGAVSYQISTDNGQTFTDAGSGTSYTVSNMQPNTEVSLIVRAVGNADCQMSANSNTATGSSTANGVIFVPNAFTPNGDGNNDVLYVYSSSIQSLNFYVYDQWGELVFRSNNQANGWDGTYKGNRMPVGVYVYYMEATTTDGQKVNKKGSITLLR
ncbi:gliding motility-associated C-terminal domain-containing protein [Mucilaginibacter limnophilus]|uniref:Gliding motility-associated C-terminal domain-containing protein n=1 Tax=Mucilaginibacter limnophilus TaxID=1932778 RepID=A0A3S2V157_9SPHI|nr:gliding motility-associated C-terminal domain-containing protein [Mucilaginibacter limnophilus]RVU00455.1 gliding motility-associated C-terminal domain-containing protein [Mucilaginibacter limnophilus]